MGFVRWLPRSLRLQFSLVLAALSLLIAAGGLVAVHALRQSAEITRQLSGERLVQMEETQELARIALQIELETNRMLAASSRERMHDSYAGTVGLLDRLDRLVGGLGSDNEYDSVLALHQAEHNFRNIVHVVAGLRGAELQADTQHALRGEQGKVLQRFQDELLHQASEMVAASGKLSAQSSGNYRAAVRQLAAMSDTNQRRILILLVGSLVAAWLISRIFLGRHVLARLRAVSLHLIKSEAGDAPVRIPVQGGDEISEMARAVEQFLEDRRQLALANQALLRSNDMQRAIFEAAPTAIFGLDLNGNVHTVWNGAAERLLGWSAAEVMGQPYPAVAPDNRSEFNSLREQIRQGMVVNGVEVRRVRRDGSPIDYSIYASPLHDAVGQVSGAIVVLVDIAERIRMEEALHFSETRLRDILGSTSDWIWELDAAGCYTFCSEGIQRVLGYCPDEIMGRTPFELMPPDEQERVGGLFQKIVDSKAPIVELENWNLARDGRRICLVTNGVPLLDDQGHILGYRGADRDITAQKLLENQVQERTRELEKINQELHNMNRLFVGRELRMVELKERIRELEGKLI
ncbi:MAG: PAS domain S-box protein [Geobacteraceae bacterium]|nr:PAS domain S-box protein [Geobacteraceae bacterium]